MEDWKIYLANKKTDKKMMQRWLKNAPPWRKPPQNVQKIFYQAPELCKASQRRGETYVSSSLFPKNDESGVDEEMQINISLMLRRPLLVTGPPGCGKSSLAYHLAWVFKLGEPLRWEINSRTTLQDGLYKYNAVDHLRAIQERKTATSPADEKNGIKIGQFITLGPLGTALLPTNLPRVLLVDELDKAGYDLPNDLLHVFEEANFPIPELIRTGEEQVSTYDHGKPPIKISQGKVQAYHHPVVVITSNQEREFPPAFLRRCICLHIDIPGQEQMEAIVKKQLGDNINFAQADFSDEATDVILQSLFVREKFNVPQDVSKKGLKRACSITSF